MAARLTPVLAGLFGVLLNALDGMNIRFHPSPPRDFAVGGRRRLDVVPRVGQVMKRLLG